LIGNLMV